MANQRGLVHANQLTTTTRRSLMRLRLSLLRSAVVDPANIIEVRASCAAAVMKASIIHRVQSGHVRGHFRIEAAGDQLCVRTPWTQMPRVGPITV
jgi:hypothetical protein